MGSAGALEKSPAGQDSSGRGPSPEPQVSATAARTYALGAGRGRLPEGCAGGSRRRSAGPRRPGHAGGPGAPGERALTCGGRGSWGGRPPPAEGKGRAGPRAAREEGLARPPAPRSVPTAPALPAPTATSPRRCFSSPRI